MKAQSLLPPRTVPASPVQPTPDVAPIRPTIAPKRSQPCGRRKVEGPRATVTKGDLARILADAEVVPSIAAGKLVIDEMCAQIVRVVKSGRRIEIRGFGTYRPKTVNTRGGFKITGGRSMPPRTVKTVWFKLSNDLRDVLPVE